MWLMFQNVSGGFGFSTWQHVLEEEGLDALAVYSWVEPETSL